MRVVLQMLGTNTSVYMRVVFTHVTVGDMHQCTNVMFTHVTVGDMHQCVCVWCI